MRSLAFELAWSKCFWSTCSDKDRCQKFGSCVALAQSAQFNPHPGAQEQFMAKQEVYNSSTLGPIPLSFTGRRLMQNLREAFQELLTKRTNSNDGTDWEPVSRARGKIAQYMSDLEKNRVTNLGACSSAQLINELFVRGINVRVDKNLHPGFDINIVGRVSHDDGIEIAQFIYERQGLRRTANPGPSSGPWTYKEVSDWIGRNPFKPFAKPLSTFRVDYENQNPYGGFKGTLEIKAVSAEEALRLALHDMHQKSWVHMTLSDFKVVANTYRVTLVEPDGWQAAARRKRVERAGDSLITTEVQVTGSADIKANNMDEALDIALKHAHENGFKELRRTDFTVTLLSEKP